MTTMKDLVSEAARLGVSITLAHLEPPYRGMYDHAGAEITVDLALTLPETKEALAHELGHAYYGHECSTPANERLAFRRAAALLVQPDQYREAELLNPDPGAIAEELGVTRRIVRIYQKTFLPAESLRKRYAS